MPHRTHRHVYIAGPYSTPYPIYNMRAALEAADRLLRLRVLSTPFSHT